MRLYKTCCLYLAAPLFALSCLLLLYLASVGPLKTEKTIIINSGTSARHISRILAEHEIIRYPFIFRTIAIAARTLGYTLKSGEYAFTSHITAFQVLQLLESGKSVIHKFVVPEGVTVNEIRTKLQNEPLLVGEVEDNIMEGFLMPSTYFFSFGDQRQKLVSQMKRLMSEALDEITPLLDKTSPIKTRSELLILASIVEKESYLEEEKPHIAAVFLNRLKKNMMLQADPTTIYAITQGKYRLARPLSKKDLKIASPYNTYYVSGLPPSPIACPSKSAIEAVAKPSKSDDLYFVVDGNGGHNFSSDLATHNSNVMKYRRVREAKRDD